MKLSILPEFHTKPSEEELTYTHPLLYQGKNKYADYILNRTFYILAFLIPLFTMLFLMKHFSYAPFGDKCMFVLDGAYINLPVLNGMIHDLQEGTFHLYSLQGSMGSEFYSSIVYYLSSPFTLICLFFSQETAVILLSFFSVLRIALSGPFFLYYLTHRRLGRAHSPHDPMLLILSLGYALSSYALVQYNDFMFLDHFMLFPILLLFLEEFMVSGKWKKFAFLNAFLLFSNFFMGLILNLLLTGYYFLRSENSIFLTLQRFFKLVATMLFSCTLSAITVIPGIYGLITNCTTSYTQLGTEHLQGDYYALFLRHIFYTSPSFNQTGYFGLNLYIGLFSLMLAFLYFFCKHFSVRRRFLDLLFLILLLLTFSSMPFSYFIHLFTINDTSFLGYTFVYLAFLLIIGSDVLPYIRTISLPRIMASFILPIGLSILSLTFVSIKPDYNAIYYSLCLFLTYGILLMLYRVGSIKRDTCYSILLCICCLEIFANAFQVSHYVSKENTSMEDVISKNSATANTQDEFSRAEIFDFPEYSYQLNLNSRFDFNSMHKKNQPEFGYTPLEDSMAGVRHLYTNGESDSTINPLQYKKITTEGEYDIYENQAIFPSAYAVSGKIDDTKINRSTFIAEQNSIAAELGSKNPIYTETHPEDVSVTLPATSNAMINDLGHQVFSFQKKENIEESYTAYPTLHFTPTQDGCLYIVLHGSPVLFGEVKAGKTYTHSFSVEMSNTHDTVGWIQFFYYDDIAHQALYRELCDNSCSMLYSGLSSFTLQADVAEDSTILTMLPYHSWIKPASNLSPEVTLTSYRDKLAIFVPAGAHTIELNYVHYPLIFGAVFTILTLVISIGIAVSFKAASTASLLYRKACVRCTKGLRKFLSFVEENQIYFLSFFIPLGCYLLIMIFCGCEPFGIASIFNGDGLSISLPSMHCISNLLKNGIPAHSWYGGGGYNTLDFIQFTIMDLPYYFIPSEYLNLFATLLAVFLLCLCGPSIVFYLTHRLNGKRAFKKDYRLLIPAMCYTFCNYNLLVINNISWYISLMLLPLILLSMDYLMEKGKYRYYMITLALSLIIQYYLTMFICFFLVIYFFTYRFETFKDFFKKGVRFATASLSTGFLSFYTLYFALSGLFGNTYAKKDSAFPSSYLFNGFEYLFNRLSIFAEGFVISWENGNANLYFGILALLLLAIFLLQKTGLREKLRYLIPFVIFFFALNHSILNYIFNGLHYQNGVPNRFAFLVAITAAFISYDSICLLQKISCKKILLASIGIFTMFTISYVITPNADKNQTSYISTMVCLLIYTILLCRPYFKEMPRKLHRKLLISLFVLELFANAAYQISQQIGSTFYLSNMSSAATMVNQEYNMENSLDHVSIYSPNIHNLPYVYNLKSTMQFSPMLTEAQLNFADYLGCAHSSNAIHSTSTQTPLGYAIGNTRYLLLYTSSYTSNIKDIKYHTPVALKDLTIIYENTRCFPFAYYLPSSVSSLMNQTFLQQEFWNELSSTILNITDIMQYAVLVDNCTLKNTSEYPSENYFTAERIESAKEPYYNLDMHLTVPLDGSIYIQKNDFQYIGEYKAGEKMHLILDGRSIRSTLKSTDETNDVIMHVMNNDMITALNDKINEHPFHVTSFTNDSVSGTIDMPEDGYVNFTMPYDERWHVLVDGKETKAESLGNGFFTIYAEKGAHEIRLDYVDNRRFPVLLATIFFWIGFMTICLLIDKRKKYRNQNNIE